MRLSKRLYNNVRAVPAASVAAAGNVPSDTITRSTLTTVVALLNITSNMVLFQGKLKFYIS